MKRFPIVAAVLLLLVAGLMAGCGKKGAMDIQVADIKSACEGVDALDVTMGELLGVLGNATSDADLNETQRAELKALRVKLEEINQHCMKNFKKDEAANCPKWEEMRMKGDRMPMWLREEPDGGS